MPNARHERRTEPRFAVEGVVKIESGSQNWEANAVDVSLNGLKIALPQGLSIDRGAAIKIEVWIDQTCHFRAEGIAAHQEADALGVEFLGMAPQDFDILSGLILMLGQSRHAA